MEFWDVLMNEYVMDDPGHVHGCLHSSVSLKGTEVTWVFYFAM